MCNFSWRTEIRCDVKPLLIVILSQPENTPKLLRSQINILKSYLIYREILRLNSRIIETNWKFQFSFHSQFLSHLIFCKVIVVNLKFQNALFWISPSVNHEFAHLLRLRQTILFCCVQLGHEVDIWFGQERRKWIIIKSSSTLLRRKFP